MSIVPILLAIIVSLKSSSPEEVIAAHNKHYQEQPNVSLSSISLLPMTEDPTPQMRKRLTRHIVWHQSSCQSPCQTTQLWPLKGLHPRPQYLGHELCPLPPAPYLVTHAYMCSPSFLLNIKKLGWTNSLITQSSCRNKLPSQYDAGTCHGFPDQFYH